MQIRESDIRDSLSENLEILEQGLKLVDKERYLPNIQGTRGYVDILAQDKNNKHVLIEIKRSRASSREALHEILKYFEALKTNLCARDSEIRMFIVSTEWTELLVPFSSFVKRVDCEVTGYFLETDNDGNPANSTIVEPLELADDRLFAPWHEVNYYTSELSLEEGIRSYERTCKLKGIRNFVLVILQAKEGRHQRSVDALKTYLSQLGQSMGFDTTKHSDFVENQEEHKYLAYFAHIVLPASACLDFIKKSLPEVELQEFLSYIEGMDNGEQLTAAHEKLHDASPRPKRDYFDIGYPSKFSAFLAEEDGWEGGEVKLNRSSLAREDVKQSANGCSAHKNSLRPPIPFS
ncbi:MAG: DUF91 domain-containing protein [Proteobacteria bacterium]|nr:MAG: DUF91 domain-containing protein [Pseudomonadota bacterium]